VKSHSILVTAW